MIDQKLFINRLYDESMTLIIEARNYFQFSDAAQNPADSSIGPEDKMYVNTQAMRFTSRMTQTMAWLLAQRAVHNGELSAEEACDGTFSLGGEPICTEAEGHDDNRLPEGLRHLLNRSHSLYHRVWRLDQNSKQRINDGKLGAREDKLICPSDKKNPELHPSQKPR